MATYSPDPRRYVGPERLLLEAMHRATLDPSAPQRIDLPVPNKHAGLTLRARLWGLVKAIESLTNPTKQSLYGIGADEAARLLAMAASARGFTSSLQPKQAEGAQVDIKSPHVLTFLPIFDTDNYSAAVDTLTNLLMNGD